MFKINHSDLIIGGNLWVFKLDKSVLIDITEPELYEYKGRFAGDNANRESLTLTNITTHTDIIIPVKINGYVSMEIFETNEYIIAPRRTRVIEIIRNVAIRPALNEMWSGIPKDYLKLLEKNKPELLI